MCLTWRKILMEIFIFLGRNYKLFFYSALVDGVMSVAEAEIVIEAVTVAGTVVETVV